MKHSMLDKPTKKFGVLIATALVGLLAAGGATAANAVEEETWSPQSSRSLYAIYDNEGQCYDGTPVLVQAETNVAEGESLTNTLLDGNPLGGDAETRVGPGVHNYTYVVTNLNSTTDPQESVTLSGSFTVPECEVVPPDPEPVAPIVDAVLTGILENNVPAVHAVVTVVPNDAEGPLTVVISHGGSESPDATLEFPPGTETLRVTFPSECGSIEFSVRFADSPNGGQSYVVDVPCPVTDGGNNGGNPGGNPDDGLSPTGPEDTDGTDNGAAPSNPTNPTTPNGPTNDVPGGKTDGFGLQSMQSGAVSPIMIGGGLALALVMAIGFVAYKRRQSLAGE